MAWTYAQQTGALQNAAGVVLGHGYSGRENGLNNPVEQQDEGTGPIPRGTWTIGAAFTHALAGPVTMRLARAAGTEVFGRDGFMIHGDTQAHFDHPTPENSASHGCVILSRALREQISGSADRTLIVTA